MAILETLPSYFDEYITITVVVARKKYFDVSFNEKKIYLTIYVSLQKKKKVLEKYNKKARRKKL